jgi:hypothetical protein
MKYNCVIMLKEILKHTSKYLNDDMKEWIFKKALQGSRERERERERGRMNACTCTDDRYPHFF